MIFQHIREKITNKVIIKNFYQQKYKFKKGKTYTRRLPDFPYGHH